MSGIREDTLKTRQVHYLRGILSWVGGWTVFSAIFDLFSKWIFIYTEKAQTGLVGENSQI